jgi:toxin FitB
MIVVDTNVWSELTKAAPSETVRRWEAENAENLWLATIVLAELRGGIALMPEGRKRSDLASQTDRIVEIFADRILPFDAVASQAYGRVLLSARQAGRPIMTADAMIAATALANGMRVATRNMNDFAGAGVELVNPWNP